MCKSGFKVARLVKNLRVLKSVWPFAVTMSTYLWKPALSSSKYHSMETSCWNTVSFSTMRTTLSSAARFDNPVLPSSSLTKQEGSWMNSIEVVEVSPAPATSPFGDASIPRSPLEQPSIWHVYYKYSSTISVELKPRGSRL